MASLPARWKAWVLNNLLKGSDANALLDILLEHGFTFEACQNALGNNLAIGNKMVRDNQFYQRLGQPELLNQLAQLNADFVEQQQAQLIKLDGFLSESECQQIVTLAKSRLRVSETSVTSGADGFRTASTCDLSILEDPQVKLLENRIIQCLGLGIGEHEIMQAQHYAIGQQFKAHTDYFEPGTDEYQQHAKVLGQRSWTFMIYLNQSCEGGATEFPLLGHKFKPQTGTALIWNNLKLDGTPNDMTLHQSHPVTDGEKTIITKWFRDRDALI